MLVLGTAVLLVSPVALLIRAHALLGAIGPAHPVVVTPALLSAVGKGDAEML